MQSSYDRINKEPRRSASGAAALVLIAAAFAGTACGPNQRIINSAATPESISASDQQEKKSPFENDLQAMRNADFNYIYVFRRKDGIAFDEDDKAFVNAVAPAETNRKRLSDEGRAVILGSNFKFTPEVLKPLADRFDFTDHSKPESEIIAANSNSNANK